MQIQNQLFPLGRLVANINASSSLRHSEMLTALKRHAIGDWGDLCPVDRESNDLAILTGTRLLSAYKSATGVSFWIITEADRSATTVLLPEEY